MNMRLFNSNMAEKMPYWGELEKLSKDDKKTLITMLSLSIADADRKSAKNNKTREMIDKCCGAWVGNLSAEEIITNINESKKSDPEPIRL